MLKKSSRIIPIGPIILYISHYTQVELTIMLTKPNIMRHEETWLHLSSVTISVLHVLRFESGHQLIDQSFTSP